MAGGKMGVQFPVLVHHGLFPALPPVHGHVHARAPEPGQDHLLIGEEEATEVVVGIHSEDEVDTGDAAAHPQLGTVATVHIGQAPTVLALDHPYAVEGTPMHLSDGAPPAILEEVSLVDEGIRGRGPGVILFALVALGQGRTRAPDRDPLLMNPGTAGAGVDHAQLAADGVEAGVPVGMTLETVVQGHPGRSKYFSVLTYSFNKCEFIGLWKDAPGIDRCVSRLSNVCAAHLALCRMMNQSLEIESSSAKNGPYS